MHPDAIGQPGGGESQGRTAAVVAAWAAAILVVRTLVALNLDLHPDETYYWGLDPIAVCRLPRSPAHGRLACVSVRPVAGRYGHGRQGTPPLASLVV